MAMQRASAVDRASGESSYEDEPTSATWSREVLSEKPVCEVDRKTFMSNAKGCMNTVIDGLIINRTSLPEGSGPTRACRARASRHGQRDGCGRGTRYRLCELCRRFHLSIAKHAIIYRPFVRNHGTREEEEEEDRDNADGRGDRWRKNLALPIRATFEQEQTTAGMHGKTATSHVPYQQATRAQR